MLTPFRRLKIDPSSYFLFLVDVVLFDEFSAGSGPVGLPVEGEDFGVVHESVDHRCSDDVVGEDPPHRPKSRFDVISRLPCS